MIGKVEGIILPDYLFNWQILFFYIIYIYIYSAFTYGTFTHISYFTCQFNLKFFLLMFVFSSSPVLIKYSDSEIYAGSWEISGILGGMSPIMLGMGTTMILINPILKKVNQEIATDNTFQSTV